jgi:sialate O-acetylesterase
MHPPRPAVLAFLFLSLVAARAEVVLAPIFTDYAVLQRERPLPIWGTADAGEKVTVSFAGQSRAATAAADGRWLVILDALPANSTGSDLVVTGTNTLTLRDLVVGEDWLCSGQSNMEFTVDARPGTWQATGKTSDAGSEIAAANFPLIRHIRIEQTVATTPAGMVKTSGWQITTPRTVGSFTAVGYFFARDLFQKLGVPIGLVHSSYGGTPVEAWMSPAALASSPDFARVGERWAQDLAG